MQGRLDQLLAEDNDPEDQMDSDYDEESEYMR